MDGNGFIEGIDVSKWQREVNWQRVRAAGKQFAFARVSDGVNVHDAYFDNNWKEMGRLGLFRGVYQMFRASQDPQAQAELLIQKVGTLGPGDLPPVLDLELTDGQPIATVLERALTWLKVVEEHLGHPPVIYTAHYFWKQLGNPEGFENYPLWVANYDVSKPRLPQGWSRWSFWQYSQSGHVPGVNGNVDLDRFSGTLSDLKELARGYPSSRGGPPPPPATSAPAA
ncbi:glycoside hydrolase family 25 protein [Vitiosangium sp. GDMCC 1.1324]|uniref:glycoside hydrolase family 25 protein n=1 Tax=Vitiosangium sp. (strain GDMCC 1.1324) TaxID=2138576 RepID=UPI000D38CC4E|nr:GH25 family lysozyme [Vitiosangium sp. GDMCC 1.1324]PTL83720.1 glycoside hydrolase [Vitiosangium sp. GDMCC 1.1324]